MPLCVTVNVRTDAKGFGSFSGGFSETDNDFFKSIFGDGRTLHTYLLSNLSSHHNTSRFRLPNHIALYVTFCFYFQRQALVLLLLFG